jgi:hypothetical protein
MRIILTLCSSLGALQRREHERVASTELGGVVATGAQNPRARAMRSPSRGSADGNIAARERREAARYSAILTPAASPTSPSRTLPLRSRRKPRGGRLWLPFPRGPIGLTSEFKPSLAAKTVADGIFGMDSRLKQARRLRAVPVRITHIRAARLEWHGDT